MCKQIALECTVVEVNKACKDSGPEVVVVAVDDPLVVTEKIEQVIVPIPSILDIFQHHANKFY